MSESDSLESLSDSERASISSKESHQGYPGHAEFGSSQFLSKILALCFFPCSSNNSVIFPGNVHCVFLATFS